MGLIAYVRALGQSFVLSLDWFQELSIRLISDNNPNISQGKYGPAASSTVSFDVPASIPGSTA